MTDMYQRGERFRLLCVHQDRGLDNCVHQDKVQTVGFNKDKGLDN